MKYKYHQKILTKERRSSKTDHSWIKGFYHEMTNDPEDLMHYIHYIPAPNVLPTKYDTTQKIMTQMKGKDQALGLLGFTYLVIAHEIYSKF